MIYLAITHTNAGLPTCASPPTPARTHTNARPRMRVHTHTHTHTHTQTQTHAHPPYFVVTDTHIRTQVVYGAVYFKM